MMPHKKILDYFQQIPFQIRRFIGIALGLAIAWKLIYLVFFLRARLIDRHLTNHVGKASAYLLNHFSGFNDFSAVPAIDSSIMEGKIQVTPVCKILHHNLKVLHIADGCNGLELMVLYTGFILCFQESVLRKIRYIIFGCIFIDGMNILRCSLLGFIKEYYHPYFNFSHHFVFKIIIYSVIVCLWVQYTQKLAFHETGNE